MTYPDNIPTVRHLYCLRPQKRRINFFSFLCLLQRFFQVLLLCKVVGLLHQIFVLFSRRESSKTQYSTKIFSADLVFWCFRGRFSHNFENAYSSAKN